MLCARKSGQTLFQSTLPRGSDCNFTQEGVFVHEISIHAPSRERLLAGCLLKRWKDFNPRSLAGATASIDSSRCISDISIHAPSRERPSALIKPLIRKDFNPRSLVGATRYTRFCLQLPLFQSTLPRGSDSAASVDDVIYTLFQSTLPRGSDPPALQVPCWGIISIHAPSRERQFTLVTSSIRIKFQSTLPRGSDAFSYRRPPIVYRFQSTLPRGSDRLSMRILYCASTFQSTLPRGSDL